MKRKKKSYPLGRILRVTQITMAVVFLVTMNATGLYLTATAKDTIPDISPPQEYLAMRCGEIEGCDPMLLESIVSCESGWRMVQNAHSSAFGYFQILDATEKTTPQYAVGLRKFNPYANIDMGIYLYNRYGTSPWNESKHCWRVKYHQALQ